MPSKRRRQQSGEHLERCRAGFLGCLEPLSARPPDGPVSRFVQRPLPKRRSIMCERAKIESEDRWRTRRQLSFRGRQRTDVVLPAGYFPCELPRFDDVQVRVVETRQVREHRASPERGHDGERPLLPPAESPADDGSPSGDEVRAVAGDQPFAWAHRLQGAPGLRKTATKLEPINRAETPLPRAKRMRHGGNTANRSSTARPARSPAARTSATG